MMLRCQRAASLEGMLKQGRKKGRVGPTHARGIQALGPSCAKAMSFLQGLCWDVPWPFQVLVFFCGQVKCCGA